MAGKRSGKVVDPNINIPKAPVKKSAKKVDCDCDQRWKDRNPYGCDKKFCDWRDLEYTQEAILLRIKTETKIIDDIKKNVIAGKNVNEKELIHVVDITKGLQIMADALVEDFKMTEDEIKKQVGFKKDSLGNKMKLAMRMAQFKTQRGRQKK